MRRKETILLFDKDEKVTKNSEDRNHAIDKGERREKKFYLIRMRIRKRFPSCITIGDFYRINPYEISVLFVIS